MFGRKKRTMKNLIGAGIFCSLLVIFLDDGQISASKNKKKSNWTSDIICERAVSLLKAGKEDMALELYFKSVNMNRPSLPRIYPILKKIGEIYLKKEEYQKAIYFFKEFEWMEQLDISFSHDTLPEIDLTDGVIIDNPEMWNLTIDGEFNPLKATVRKACEKELAEFKLQLEELEKKHLK